MSIVKYNRPTGLFPALPSVVEDFFRDDDGFFSRFLHNRIVLPAVNVRETDLLFNVEIAAPGMKREDFNVEIEENLLRVSAENKYEKEEELENYTRKEFGYTTFTRSFWLPENVKAEKIEAIYKDGMLLISLPKVEPTPKTPKKVIKVS